MLKSYIAFDLETTGLSPQEHEIIEIGALKVREGKVVDRFMEFVHPDKPITPTSHISQMIWLQEQDPARKSSTIFSPFVKMMC